MNDSSATTKAALWVGTVFLLGAALGGVLGYLSAHRTASAANPPLSEPERRARRVEQLTRDLSLTPAQSQQVNSRSFSNASTKRENATAVVRPAAPRNFSNLYDEFADVCAGEEHVDGIGRFLQSFDNHFAILQLAKHFPLAQLRCRLHEP